MALPNDAVVEDGDNNIVLKLKRESDENYVFEPIEVLVKNSYSDYTQIISKAIMMKDKVLIKGAFDLVGGGE